MNDCDDINVLEGTPRNTNSAIVLVAKCPIPGKSKTRLAKDKRLGNEGAADLARAMISDVLERVGRYPSFKKVLKILLYAPGNEEGETIMSDLLASLKSTNSSIFNTWVLMPMNDSSIKDMTSSNLGDKLKSALRRTRQLLISSRKDPSDCKEDGGVLFIGMDAPDIPLDEMLNGILHSSPPHNQAFLCPTYDGGYGVIGIPPCAPIQVFDGVRWSDPLTTTSQIKALSDWNTSVVMGKIMYDVDEPEDIPLLADRICTLNNAPNHYCNVIKPNKTDRDALTRPSSPPVGALGIAIVGEHSFSSSKDEKICKWTLQVLLKYEFLKESKDENNENVLVTNNNNVL